MEIGNININAEKVEFVNPKWIKIKEKTPPQGEVVLFGFKQIVRTGYLFEGSFYKNHNQGDNDPIYFEDPLFWMPLPNPPKQKEV